MSQESLRSNIPARLAYTGRDGAPREALTIDTNTFPPHVLLIRGTSSIEVGDGVPSDYLAASRKYVGEQGYPAFEEQVRGLYTQMARIAIEPTRAKLLGFERTLPSAVEQLLNR